MILYESLRQKYFEIVNKDSIRYKYCNLGLSDILLRASKEIIIFLFIFYVLFLENETVQEGSTEQNDNSNISSWDQLKLFLVKYKIIIVVYLFMINANIDSLSIELLFKPVKVYLIGYLLLFSGKLIYVLLPLFLIYFLYTYISEFKKLKKLLYHEIDLSIIPKEIRDYINSLGVGLKVFNVISQNPNISIGYTYSNITLFLSGDIEDFLTMKEFISCLYHEIGHFVNSGVRRFAILFLFKAFIFCITLYILNKNGLKLVENPIFFEQVEYSMNLLMIAILLLISFVPLISALTNFINYYEEIKADRFSVSRANKKYLISALKKLSLLSGNCFDCSWLFNIMFLKEPTMDRRIEIIRSM